MIILTSTIKEDVQKMENFRERGFARIMKRALKDAVLAWHEQFLPRHFTRAAYGHYGFLGAYRRHKKRGEPYVQSGTMRERFTARRTEADVTGTAKRVRLRLPFGIPPQYTPESLKAQVFIEMRQRNLSYTQAQALVYRAANYSQAMREAAQRDIKAMSNPEMHSLREHLKNLIVIELNKAGPKRARKVSG